MRDAFAALTLATLPAPLNDAVTEFICHVTRRLSPIDPEVMSGSISIALDCADGTSVRMKKFCWCDHETCPWCGDLEDAAEETLDAFEAAGYVAHERAPNLWVRLDGRDVRIWWYKHAGRSLVISGLSSVHELDEIRKSFDSWADAHAEEIDVASTYQAVSSALGMMSNPLSDAIAGAFAAQVKASDKRSDMMSGIAALLPDMDQTAYAHYQAEKIDKLLDEHDVPGHDEDEDTPAEFVMRYSFEARLRRLFDFVDVKAAVARWRADLKQHADFLDEGPFEGGDVEF